MNARMIFKAVAIAGVPVTGYLSAKGAYKYERILRENGEPLTKVEKAKDLTKSYWPALLCGGATIGSILMTDKLATNAIAAATASATLAIAKKDILKGEFEKYRQVVKEDAGSEKDIEYLQKASEVRLDEDGEAVHRFKICFMDEPIYIESTLAKVEKALNSINRDLFDYNTGIGTITISDCLRYFEHEELRNSKTDLAGWTTDLLAVNCDCYWLDFYVYKASEGLSSHGDEDPDLYIIDVVWPPEENIREAYRIAEKEGII